MIDLEHFKQKSKFGSGKLVGYDSYYPTFDENKTEPEKKNQFKLEVTPAGKILSFMPFEKNTTSKIVYTAIESSYNSYSYHTLTTDRQDSLMIRLFSSTLMQPIYKPEFKNANQIIGIRYIKINEKDSVPTKVPYLKENRVPLLIKFPGSQLILTNASFPITHNSIIQGRIKDQINKEIKITMFGENPEYYFPEKQFLTNKDGSFICSIFLKSPLHLKIQIGDKSLTTFMEPGDTLNISAIGHQQQVSDYEYSQTKPNGYFALNENKADYFSGNAGYNTMLSNEMDQYKKYFSDSDNFQSVVLCCENRSKEVNELIEIYRGKASEACIDYFGKDWNYYIAGAKLDFYNNRSIPKNVSEKKLKIKNYPPDFLLEVDTMSILMNPFEWNSSYQNFIQRAQQFKQNRLCLATGKRPTENFRESYFFTQASLLGYPLSMQIFKLIDLELRKGLSNNNIIEPYYQDFINNCSDPLLVEPLKKVYETAVQLRIGNQFPITSFLLQDSSIFNLEKFKGKPICLILLDSPKSYINNYKETFEKFGSEDVEFIFAKLPVEYMDGGKVDSTILERPNVTYIELSEKTWESKLLLNRTKIFMLDKWFRIDENNAEDLSNHLYQGGISEFEKSLRKTIDAKRYSKAEKTAMVKTAGWSFGSILFTFLAGLGIYRIRVRRIRAQEAIKRRIKELEIKAIRSQMNPHFIFNALNSIQSLINGNQFKEANIYLSKFAILLRGVLNNSEKTVVSLSEELLAVELYCQLEQLRFEFKFEINIDPDVKSDLIEIPGMIIQPLAENAIVHGLSAKGEKGKLSIRVERQNGNLCIGVADNGAGLLPEFSDSLSQKGFGLKLVEERINILNLDGKEARLTVENNRNNTGTTATLTIPID